MVYIKFKEDLVSIFYKEEYIPKNDRNSYAVYDSLPAGEEKEGFISLLKKDENNNLYWEHIPVEKGTDEE
jgi:hypothetical protein